MSLQEPCPIPRCALEWHCAFSLIITASILGALMPGRFGMAALLVIVGIAQAVSLSTPYRVIQRWTALAGCLASVLIVAAVASSPIRPDAPLIVFGLLAATTASEGYVFLLLKGARWPRSLAG